ncbi:MAG: DUF2339 domain-containing protein [Candidatus Obscuribacter sp.]|nr:DUF2339 domain-containing protein [Candidatus Obscuribacter sp.]
MFSLSAQHLVNANYVSLCYTLQAAVCLAFGLKFRDGVYIVTGLLCGAKGLLDVGYTYKIWETAPVAAQVLICYALALYTRHLAKTDELEESKYIKNGAYFAATIILTFLLNAKVPSTYLTLSFGIEGLSLMAAAWMLKEKTLRAQAFAVIFILVSKLLFVDLANRGTLERIVSFIGAGVTVVKQGGIGSSQRGLPPATVPKIVVLDSPVHFEFIKYKDAICENRRRTLALP